MIADYGDANVNANPQTEKSDSSADQDMARLVERATKGDATVLPKLRRLLDESPELWRGYGDLALQARSSWIQLAAGQNLLLDECLTRKAGPSNDAPLLPVVHSYASRPTPTTTVSTRGLK